MAAKPAAKSDSKPARKSAAEGSAAKPAAKAEKLARDLMQRDVVSFAADTPLQEAVETLEEYRITGAPVLDDSGRILGFLSIRDVARSEHLREEGLEPDRGERGYDGELDEDDDGELYDEEAGFLRDDYNAEVLRRETVGDWMSHKVVGVRPDDDVPTVCRKMVREGVHRVLVIEERVVKGILSSWDVVRHVAER